MVERVIKWRDDLGNLHDTEVSAGLGDVRNALRDHLSEFGDTEPLLDYLCEHREMRQFFKQFLDAVDEMRDMQEQQLEASQIIKD